MSYLSRNLHRRGDPREILSDVKSILCVGLNYHDGEQGSPKTSWGRIARYARGEDYHGVMEKRLSALLEYIRDDGGKGIQGKVYVDTGPVLERDAAVRAGLGWFGKHTGLIHKRKGSWFLLGEVLLTADLEYDSPVGDHCGTCRRCMDACPTEAIREPYVVDARRCISYLTIEARGPIPRSLRSRMGNWIFGCDICQEVCPWNRKAPPSPEEAFAPREGIDPSSMSEWFELDPQEFRRRFRGTPMLRAKRRGLLRNAAVALGNSGDPEAVPALAIAVRDPEPLVRRHAAWALGRLGGSPAKSALIHAFAGEEDPEVRVEIQEALASLEIP